MQRNTRKNIILGSLIAGAVIGGCITTGFVFTRQQVVKQTAASASLLAAVLPARPITDIAGVAPKVIPPPLQREFRGVWIATVLNVDWPSAPGLTSEQQKAELIAMLDRAVKLKLNAVIFQVRPACDALYASPYEPWSESLSGQMGKAPEPYYDPLVFAVEQAHKRGLELHAWFNPYRAYHAKSKSEISANHISKTHPELVRQYGKSLWLDPGEKAVQDYTLAVIMDVVRRYDIDGVHIDDYFYPYNEGYDFPDDASWQKYQRSGGNLSRNNWRRENINKFVQRLYRSIKQKKSWVKFGISPFGIWRPGYPSQIQGLDAYSEIYSDSRKWLKNGWVDYFAPQLYWKIAQTKQSYPVLLSWWSKQNPFGRHIWVGNYTSQVGDGSSGWAADEILSQIQTTRHQLGVTGNIHFSMKPLMENREGISTKLATSAYSIPALVPASPWLNDKPPGKPAISAEQNPTSGAMRLTWKPFGTEKVWLWVVQTKKADVWTTQVLPGMRTSYLLNSDSAKIGEIMAVSAVDRYGNQGAPAVVEVKDNS